MGADNIIWNNFGKLLIILTVITVFLQCYHVLYVMKIQGRPNPSLLMGGKGKKVPKIPMDILKIYVQRIQNAHKMDSSGTYMVVPNIAKAAMDASKSNLTNLSICTQSTVKNLVNLANLLRVWQGPVSVTVFAHGRDVLLAAYAIAYYTSCYKQISHQVSFHIAFPIRHPPENLEHLVNVDLSCGKNRFTRPSANSSMNYANTKIPYPHNMLRNVAVYFAETSYILVTDIDMVPSVNLQSDFFKLSKRKGGNSKLVFVLPVFEAKASNQHYDKPLLLTQWKTEQVRPFYEKVCSRCQQPTNYERWQDLPNMGFLDIGYILEWRDPWEPFYIALKQDLPQYDGRFKQYGFNRISQVVN